MMGTLTVSRRLWHYGTGVRLAVGESGHAGLVLQSVTVGLVLLLSLCGRLMAAPEGTSPAEVPALSGEASATGKGAPCRVAVVFSSAGKFDKSFSEQAWYGVQDARRTLDLTITEYDVPVRRDDADILKQAAASSDMVVTVGYSFDQALSSIAGSFPSTRFVAIGARVQGDNVLDVSFREQDGAYLAGVLAALTSKSGVVGFVGGLDIPVIRHFRHGFEQGVHSVSPSIRVLSVFVGDDLESGFRNSYGGYIQAQALIRKGADVVFAAAGATGLGAYQAAADMKVSSIGVDADQTALFAGSMLASMVKETGRIVEQQAARCSSIDWKPGHLDYGLESHGISLVFSRTPVSLVPVSVREEIASTLRGLVNKTIVVSPDP